jgi:hypothetical protein
MANSSEKISISTLEKMVDAPGSPKAAAESPTTPSVLAKQETGGGLAAMMGVSKALKKFKGKASSPKKADNQHSAKKDAFLIDACSQGSLNLVQKFITENHCSPNLKSPEGKCLIQLALEGGHEEVVMCALEPNANCSRSLAHSPSLSLPPSLPLPPNPGTCSWSSTRSCSPRRASSRARTTSPSWAPTACTYRS